MELRCKKVKDIVLENSASASVFFNKRDRLLQWKYEFGRFIWRK